MAALCAGEKYQTFSRQLSFPHLKISDGIKFLGTVNQSCYSSVNTDYTRSDKDISTTPRLRSWLEYFLLSIYIFA